MAESEAPKIIVDTDWKSQAQAEKEKLAAAEKAKAPAPRSGPGAMAGEVPQGDEGGPPQASVEELVRVLATQALLYLGAFPDPESGRRIVSLELAQFNIDMLTVFEDKTRNNLTEPERAFLSRMLHELRMQFVEISKAVAKAVEQGRISPTGGPGPAGAPAINIRPPQKN